MKKFIMLYVALILSVAEGSAMAAEGDMGFYYGAQSPQHLAELVAASLKKDATGNTMLDAAKCKADGSCARPIDYLKMFKEFDPKSTKLNAVSDLPAFISRLRVDKTPRYFKYEVSCLKPSQGGTFTPVLHCLDREFEEGESAWIDPDTDFVLMMGKCANPVRGPVPIRIIGGGLAPLVCPNGFSVTANAWSLASFPPALQTQANGLIVAANARNALLGKSLDQYQVNAVSRSLGKAMREQVKTRASVNTDITIHYVKVVNQTEAQMDTQTGAHLVERKGVLRLVNGVGTFKFDSDPRQQVVEMVWPEEFLSPTVSGVGAHKRLLRIFPWEWASCDPHANGIVP